jgi:hypothetical protein
MRAIIKRFDRAPLEDRLLRANPAQPPKARGGRPAGPRAQQQAKGAQPAQESRRPRGGKKHRKPSGPPSAFAEELAKAL